MYFRVTYTSGSNEYCSYSYRYTHAQHVFTFTLLITLTVLILCSIRWLICQELRCVDQPQVEEASSKSCINLKYTSLTAGLGGAVRAAVPVPRLAGGRALPQEDELHHHAAADGGEVAAALRQRAHRRPLHVSGDYWPVCAATFSVL